MTRAGVRVLRAYQYTNKMRIARPKIQVQAPYFLLGTILDYEHSHKSRHKAGVLQRFYRRVASDYSEHCPRLNIQLF